MTSESSERDSIDQLNLIDTSERNHDNVQNITSDPHDLIMDNRELNIQEKKLERKSVDEEMDTDNSNSDSDIDDGNKSKSTTKKVSITVVSYLLLYNITNLTIHY